MLFIKMMSGEELPDTSLHKSFDLIQVPDLESISFSKEASDSGGDFNESHPYTMTIKRDGEVKVHYALSGNVYIMSEHGKTIATHGF